MKAVKLSIIGIISIFFLNACSGGSSNDNNSTIDNNDTVITLCPNRTTLKKGDKVIALEDNTEIKVIHKDDGTKTVCITKGKAVYTSVP